jgi:hypothetical protein
MNIIQSFKNHNQFSFGMEELFPFYDFAEEHFINFKIESEKISQP